MQTCIARARSTVQTDGNAGLNDAITVGDYISFFIVYGVVEWVRHDSDKFPGGIAGQLCVCIEGDDVFYCGDELLFADDDSEGLAFSLVNEAIEVSELS